MLRNLLSYCLVLVIAAFFALMWGLQLRRHLPAEPPEEGLRAEFTELLPPGQSRRSSRWDIYLSGGRVGSSEVQIRREEAGTFKVNSTSEITIGPAAGWLLGFTGHVDLRFSADISPVTGLRFLQIESEVLDIQLIGSVREGRLTLRGHMGSQDVRTDMPYKAGRFLGDMLSPLTPVRELSEDQIGRSWTVEMINPLAAEVQQVQVTVLRSKEILLSGESTRCFQLLFSTGRNRWTSWVRGNGEVLVQGTPFGFVLRRGDLPPAARRLLEASVPTPPGAQ